MIRAFLHIPDTGPMLLRMADFRCVCGGQLQPTAIKHDEDAADIHAVCMACGARPVTFLVAVRALYGRPAEWLGREMGVHLRDAVKQRRLVLASVIEAREVRG